MKKDKVQKAKGPIREYAELIAETSVFVFFIMTFVAQAAQIPTPSMEKTMLVGDHILINKFIYAQPVLPAEKLLLPSRPIERNDFVIFKSLEEPDKDVVKRVIAVAGDKVEIRAKRVYVNDAPLREKYKVHIDSQVYAEEGRFSHEGYRRDNFGPVVVPDGHVFAMGDNRDNSLDSRFWGFLPVSRVKGRPWLVYFSYETLENPHLRNSPKDRLDKLVRAVTRIRWKRILKVYR
ncbi:MAG: signal peptidase I [Candidatus Aminicenantes bacterium RBG_16_63_16]|nr:MAG: signal peptidase I [Candidatus Aminicenantes bacterium RBG_16_63_16]